MAILDQDDLDAIQAMINAAVAALPDAVKADVYTLTDHDPELADRTKLPQDMRRSYITK